MSILHKAIYRFNAITIKISVAFFFTEIGKINPKIHMEYTHTHTHTHTLTHSLTHSHTSNCQSNAEKENKAGGITLPGFEIYYKIIVIKTVWYWHKNRHIDQWNRIESPEMNSRIQSTNV